MTGQPVTVLIPTYNRRALVLRAIGTCLEQTHEATRVLVYDDGSTDGTAEAVARLQETRVELERDTATGGEIESRRRLLAACRTEIACWLDSDDLCNIRRVELQLEVLREKGAPFVRTGRVRFLRAFPEAWRNLPAPTWRPGRVCPTTMFYVANAKRVGYSYDFDGGDMIHEYETRLMIGEGVLLPLNLYTIDRHPRDRLTLHRNEKRLRGYRKRAKHLRERLDAEGFRKLLPPVEDVLTRGLLNRLYGTKMPLI